ncbi:hypothetical protein [Sphingomonas melonis]|uniref:Uncharacterized protein n=1 Tax=Sphingomonas melonis TaxID=152682 RepID=A0A7Y9K378_9SPHN|nr:hypothetical protein [Sphingomonas melonis]NYD91622.1 hypothetical protein [Sphingomonas melonis]
MFPEFGQAPLCLELDLDSYEGPWQHVAAFRGRSGWLMAARATVQSAHDLLRQILIAGCDDQENPIPSWRAVHLTECRWQALEHCREQPPELLDDLLCEEEGALYARWQREMNADLAGLADRAAARIAALEARTAAATREAERQIAELNRRRRLPDTGPEARAALLAVIADIERENDEAVAAMSAERARLRRDAEAAEEMLWQRGDILFEIEPLWCVQWCASSAPTSGASTKRAGGVGFGYAQPPTRAAWRYAEFLQSEEVVADRKTRYDQASADLRAAEVALEFLQTRLKAAQNKRVGAGSVEGARNAIRDQRDRVRELKTRRGALYRDLPSNR